MAVLPRENVTVNFHFLSDTADATHPAHSSSRTASDIDAMISTANSIWNKQANVFFTTGRVDSIQYPTNLGDNVDIDTVRYWSGNNYVANQINVYFVWGITCQGIVYVAGLTEHNSAHSLQLTLISDVFTTADNKARLAPSDEGKILAHEAGHALGIDGD